MQKRYRVKKSDDISAIMKKGSSKSNPSFVVYKKENLENEHFKIAISVSKKLGNAVMRNHVKRYVRNVMQENEAYLDHEYDYFIIGRKSCTEQDYETFKRNLEQVLRRHKVLNKPTQS